MLETFISSRIRRTLLEHILVNPNDRFYLRGLAKELGLPVSPLRRELKRLEEAGMLKTFQEGNILFYIIKTESPLFHQLQQASGSKPAAPGPILPQVPTDAMPVGVISAKPRWALWRSALPTPALVAAAGVGVVLMLIVTGLFYLRLTNERLLAAVERELTTKADTTVAPSQSSIVRMRGSRWQIVPGGFGGFSTGTNAESF